MAMLGNNYLLVTNESLSMGSGTSASAPVFAGKSTFRLLGDIDRESERALDDASVSLCRRRVGSELVA